MDRARLLDISGGGVQLQARTEALAAGDQVSLEFRFGGQDYRLTAVVMWARRAQFANAWRAGLRFEGMPDAERESLVREIYRAQRGGAGFRRA